MVEYYLGGKLDPNGTEVDRLAKLYAADHRVDYVTAVKAVMKEARAEFEAKKGRAYARYDREHPDEPRGQWRVYQDGNGIAAAELQAPNATAINQLSNMATGCPRNADGSINADLVVRVVTGSFSDLAQNAAGEFLYRVAERLTGEGNIPLADRVRQAQDLYPEVDSVYRGAQLTVDVLKQILWPLFKDSPAPKYEYKGETRRYSSDRQHIYRDANGNEVHRY